MAPRVSPVDSAISRALLPSANQTATRLSAGVSAKVVSTRAGSTRRRRPGSTIRTSAATCRAP